VPSHVGSMSRRARSRPDRPSDRSSCQARAPPKSGAKHRRSANALPSVHVLMAPTFVITDDADAKTGDVVPHQRPGSSRNLAQRLAACELFASGRGSRCPTSEPLATPSGHVHRTLLVPACSPHRSLTRDFARVANCRNVVPVRSGRLCFGARDSVQRAQLRYSPPKKGACNARVPREPCNARCSESCAV
jgi:hypothetical protein